MPKLKFYYGAMNASKTQRAISTAHNYAEINQEALVINAGADSDDSADNYLETRAGVTWPATSMKAVMNMNDIDIQGYSVVVVDNAEKLASDEIDKLVYIVDELLIPVVCYGLRSDYKGNIFPSASRLFNVSDLAEEVTTICWCKKHATMNALVDDDGNIIKDERNITKGTHWVSLCRKHWNKNQSKSPV